METFILKSISKESEDGTLIVARDRTSTGFASITIRLKKIDLKDKKLREYKSLLFTNSDEDHPDYELRVRELAEMMMDIANNACQLPE